MGSGLAGSHDTQSFGAHLLRACREQGAKVQTYADAILELGVGRFLRQEVTV